MLRITIGVVLLSLIPACAPAGIDDLEAGDVGEGDTGLDPVDVWGDVADDGADHGDDSGDEGGEGGGESGELLPDMGTDGEGTEEIVDACCVCDPSEPWCEIVDGGADGCVALHYAIGMPTEWHTDCVSVDGEIQCSDACGG